MSVFCKKDNPYFKIAILLPVIMAFTLSDQPHQKELSYADLVNRLVDFENLALLPSGEGEQPFSEIDFSPAAYHEIVAEKNCGSEKSGKYPREEGDHVVLAEMNGPGVLSLMWVAVPFDGKISVYIDGKENPVLNRSFSDLYRSWGRRFSHLVYQTGKSVNFMIPIPFQKSCKITAEENWGEVCKFGFTTFDKDTRLPVFQAEPGEDELAALERVENMLGRPGQFIQGDDISSRTEQKKISLNPGETVTVFNHKASGAITSMNVALDAGNLVPFALMRQGASRTISPSGRIREIPDTPEDRDVLRELLMVAYWDEEENPAVLTPLGDFFGSAPGWNTSRTFPAGMTPDRLYSNWFMPFKNGARITLRNDGKKTRTLTFEITYAPLNKPADRYGRLHVRWNRDQFNTNDKKQKSPAQTLLEVNGEGRFCGSVIDIYNPKGVWWGACEYAFTADSENSPALTGQSLDMYYGTWGNHFFNEAFHAHSVIDRSMEHRAHESLNRWHIADHIPFRESLKVTFKKLLSPSDSVLYTTTWFWYSNQSSGHSSADIPLNDRVDYPRVLEEFGVTNCLEGEDMKVMTCSGGRVTPLYIEGLHTGGWSGLRGKQQLWWNEINPGDTLKLALPVETGDEFKLRIQFIKGIEYGKFKLFLDNQLIEESLDLSHEGLAPSGPVDFGLHELNKGLHSITLVALPRSPGSETMQFGLDYLQLEPWDETRDPRPKTHHVVAGNFTNFFNRFNINDHCFIRANDGTWHFYGIGGNRGFAHGTSESLLNTNWPQADYPFPVSWNPWREIHLWAPHVVKHNDLYYMFYCAGSKTGYNYRMHLATSPDLKNWTRHEENPLFADGFDARDPMVLKVGEQWVMYYCANTSYMGGNHIVAYRLSKDLVHWGERHVAFVDPRRHKAGGPTESPFVVRRGDTFYLFIGPREGYVGTDVFASKDPFKWHLEDKAGHIDAHAAEVVRDTDGRWYVSHSGVGEGGLHLAPLYWNDELDEADTSLPVPGETTP